MPVPRLMRRVPRLGAVLTAVVATALLVTPATLYASDRFTDVPDDHPFHHEINDIAAAGVTQGCTEDRYCPGQAVTRGQMAAFLHRIRGVDGPVVNAVTLDGRGANQFVWTEQPIPIKLAEEIDRITVSNEENDAVECARVVSLFGEDTPSAYSISLNVVNVPAGGGAGWGPWLVNVQPANVDAGRYDVCFATIDGRPLPDGDYVVFRQEMVRVGVS